MKELLGAQMGQPGATEILLYLKPKEIFDLPESCLIWVGKTLVSSPFCAQVAHGNVTASCGCGV